MKCTGHAGQGWGFRVSGSGLRALGLGLQDPWGLQSKLVRYSYSTGCPSFTWNPQDVIFSGATT